jgi:hypothetical protein
MNNLKMEQITSQHWKTWYCTSIPMLSNKTPNEAKETADGKTLLNNMLAFYDSIRHRSLLDINIPSRYAKGQLQLDGGDWNNNFSRERRIVEYNTNIHPTQREESHTKRFDQKKLLIFVPKRCEMIGCNKTDTDDVRRCGKCRCVFYCGVAHQRKDWPRHKLDCITIWDLEVKLLPKPFLYSREMVKFPHVLFPIAKYDDTATCCFICHSKQTEVNITFTDCCKLPICDNSHEYQMMSFASGFCHRSHILNTTCSKHHEEEHVGDWRDCEECNQLKHGARPFASTNGFCATPCLEKFIPQGSMLTYPCAMGLCKRRMMPGHSAEIHINGGVAICRECSCELSLPTWRNVIPKD